MVDISKVKALTFDVGGTVVDWHTGISSQLTEFGRRTGLEADWVGVTRAWRMQALEMALNANKSDLPKGNIDGVHRHVLDKVLDQFGIRGLTDAQKEEMTLFWHRVPPWPDAARGHARLRQKFIVSTLTILSVPMIIGVSRLAPFQWDCVISCEMLDQYKFIPSVYRRGAELLGYRPEEVLMVAAHKLDLQGAHSVGFRTALVRRPDEWGRGDGPEQKLDFLKPDQVEQAQKLSPDLTADSLEELADRLGA